MNSRDNGDKYPMSSHEYCGNGLAVLQDFGGWDR